MKRKASHYNFSNTVEGTDYKYYYNTYSGNLIMLDQQMSSLADKYLTSPSNDIFTTTDSQKIYDLFLSGNFIIDEEFNELSQVESMLTIGRQRNKVLAITINLTWSCNFNCHYCFQKETRRRRGELKISEETEKKIFAFIKSRVSLFDTLLVTWIGGEPLLCADRILSLGSKLTDLCNDMKIESRNLILTNAYLLDKDLSEKLSILPGLSYQITIDGDEQMHESRRHNKAGTGSYKRIYENACRLAELGHKLHIRINVDKTNYMKVEDVLCLIESGPLNIPGIAHVAETSQHPVSPDSDEQLLACRDEYNDIEYSTFKRVIDREVLGLPFIGRVTSCLGTMCSDYIIDPEGKIYKCARYMEDESYSVGDVTNEEFLHNDLFYKWVSWNPLEQKKCRQCSYLPVCMGGCPFPAIHQNRESRCGAIESSLDRRIQLHCLRNLALKEQRGGE